MATDDKELTEAERSKLYQRAKSLVLTMRTHANELDGILDALRGSVKRERKDIDKAGEPTFRFKVRVKIPDDIFLTKAMKQYALDKGYTANSVQSVWEEFVGWYRRKGTMWMDWTATWQKWVREESQRRKPVGSSRDLQEL